MNDCHMSLDSNVRDSFNLLTFKPVHPEIPSMDKEHNRKRRAPTHTSEPSSDIDKRPSKLQTSASPLYVSQNFDLP